MTNVTNKITISARFADFALDCWCEDAGPKPKIIRSGIRTMTIEADANQLRDLIAQAEMLTQETEPEFKDGLYRAANGALPKLTAALAR